MPPHVEYSLTPLGKEIRAGGRADGVAGDKLASDYGTTAAAVSMTVVIYRLWPHILVVPAPTEDGQPVL